MVILVGLTNQYGSRHQSIKMGNTDVPLTVLTDKTEALAPIECWNDINALSTQSNK